MSFDLPLLSEKPYRTGVAFSSCYLMFGKDGSQFSVLGSNHDFLSSSGENKKDQRSPDFGS